MSRFSWPDSGDEHLGLICLLLDADGRVGWSNDAAAAVASSTQTDLRALADLAHAEDQALIGDLLTTVSSQGRAVGIVRVQDTPAGSRRHFHMVLTCSAEGGSSGGPARTLPPSREGESFTADTGGAILAQAWDVTCLVRKQQELEVYAFRDNLTGLANRRTFMTLLDQALNTSPPLSPPVAVIFADLDDFKTINDTYGHHGGDYVLIEVATRLSSRLRPDDTLARIGGDEFAVICPNLTGWSAAALILERLRSAAAAPIILNGDTISVSLSVGPNPSRRKRTRHTKTGCPMRSPEPRAPLTGTPATRRPVVTDTQRKTPPAGRSHDRWARSDTTSPISQQFSATDAAVHNGH